MRKYRRRRIFKRRRFRRIGRRFTRSVRRVVNRMSETKIYQPTALNTAVRTTKTYGTWFDGIGQGIGSNQRIGNQVQGQRVNFTMNLTFSQGSGGYNAAWIRVAVIYPRKAVGGQTDMNTALNNTLIFDRFDPTLFITIFDRRLFLASMDTAQTSGGAHPVGQLHFSKRFWGKINYLSNYAHREPLLIFWSQIPDGNSSSITANYQLTTSYKDI